MGIDSLVCICKYPNAPALLIDEWLPILESPLCLCQPLVVYVGGGLGAGLSSSVPLSTLHLCQRHVILITIVLKRYLGYEIWVYEVGDIISHPIILLSSSVLRSSFWFIGSWFWVSSFLGKGYWVLSFLTLCISWNNFCWAWQKGDILPGSMLRLFFCLTCDSTCLRSGLHVGSHRPFRWLSPVILCVC